MSFMAMPPSGGLRSLSSSTSSALVPDDIIFGTVITIGALLFSLALYDMMSRDSSRNANAMAALRAIWMPLIVTFCAWLAFEVVRYWS